MENEAELIRQQMVETRTSLSEKLETLEEQVASKVRNTTEAVEETVETVREAVQDTVHTVSDTFEKTVDSVKESLNVSRHVEEHPWAMLGGAVAVGFLAERLLNRVLPPSPGGLTRSLTGAPDWSQQAPVPSAPEPRREPAGPSWSAELMQALRPALTKLGGLAVGATTAVISEVIQEHVPEQLRGQVDEILDGVTVAMGGTPIRPTRKPKAAPPTENVYESAVSEEARSREVANSGV